MLVFIDESGDAGFKIGKGSSVYFVIVLLVFKEALDAEETALAIKKLKKELNKSERFEFKFNSSGKEIRRLFFNTVHPFNFKLRAIVVNKRLIKSNLLKLNKEKFYNYCLKLVLKNSNNKISDAKIIIDKLGDRTFNKQLSTYLRKYLNNPGKRIVARVKFKDSKKDVLVQMADMLVGCIRKSYENSSMEIKGLRKIIRKHEEDIWEFK